MNQGNHLAHVSDPRDIAEIFARDTLAENNAGILGYDHSPTVCAHAEELQQRMHHEFLATLR